ncbi:MAG TPA: c-type cytochrome [Methylomirabilota bacterium]|nr:c-type cytochrome [Methylomirabilota bacterium]
MARTFRRRLLAGALLGAAALSPVTAAAQAAPARGSEVFASKRCAHCHVPRAQRGMGPPLEELRRPQGAYELSGRLWNHAPAMFTVLKQEGLQWPEIDDAEMAELMAYLQADAARDPAPDLLRGQLTLIGKGCLKCHSFRREGARIAPDLAGRPGDYAPAATWAAKMWRHTPRMAKAALERGLLYPRFTGSEMVNLLGFLRSGG